MSQIALAWVASKVSSPIVGISSIQRLQESIIEEIELTPEVIKYLEEPCVFCLRGYSNDYMGFKSLNYPEILPIQSWDKHKDVRDMIGEGKFTKRGHATPRGDIIDLPMRNQYRCPSNADPHQPGEIMISNVFDSGRRRERTSESELPMMVTCPILCPLRHSDLPYRWTAQPSVLIHSDAKFSRSSQHSPKLTSTLNKQVR